MDNRGVIPDVSITVDEETVLPFPDERRRAARRRARRSIRSRTASGRLSTAASRAGVSDVCTATSAAAPLRRAPRGRREIRSMRRGLRRARAARSPTASSRPRASGRERGDVGRPVPDVEGGAIVSGQQPSSTAQKPPAAARRRAARRGRGQSSLPSRRGATTCGRRATPIESPATICVALRTASSAPPCRRSSRARRTRRAARSSVRSRSPT